LGDFLRVLLTNDDGVEAQGLAAAREALLQGGLGVITAAPDAPRSGTSRSASFRRPISLTRHGGSDANPIYAVNGTPTDTVRVAILSGTASGIHAVVSGINEGINLGDDATYSSTLGAAMEGALLGYPSIAASQQTTDGRFRLIDLTGYDFETGARILARLAQIMIEDRAMLPPRSVLNLNSPGKPAKGLQLAHFDERIWGTESIYSVPSETGETGYLLFGTHPDNDPAFRMMPGSDAWVLAQGLASLTPINLKWSSAVGRSRLQRWTRTAVARVNEDLFGARGA
jgi:5'-nucleotidase